MPFPTMLQGMQALGLSFALISGSAMAQDAAPATTPAPSTATPDQDAPSSEAVAAFVSQYISPTTPISASGPHGAPPPRTTMTGDWGGLRTRINDAGVTLRGDYVSESFAVVDGGQRRGTSYAQQIRWGADFDMGRIAGWKGTSVHVTFNDRRGVGTSSDFVGNRLPIQEDYGGLYTRLTEASIEQVLDGGRLDIRIGFFAMGNDLGGLAMGCNFVNAAFCAHALSLSGDSGWYNYPNARWGGAVRYRLRPDITFRTGVYQVNPSLGDEANAFKPFAAGTTGALIPFEVEYDPGVRPGSRVLPGHYKLGAYYDTSRVAREAETGTVKGRYGVYVLADQMIWREANPARGLSIFGEYTAQPAVSAQITRWYGAGLLKTGTFKGRDADTIGLGFIYAKLNPRLRAAHEATSVTSPTGGQQLLFGEAVVEASYGIQVRPWLNVRPDIQYVIDPGAFSYKHIPNALAVGTQVRSQF
ncbi:carbohydrate porin [Novosphingobium terrae]|uniref:carbohydrate porin n=1 Tax=Novosphingobium terrae TaxID=2726189 RepID=UPI001F144541|nr:carbohydrate porin [Novosphingobium terrae]